MANLELAAVAVGVLLLICVSHLYMDQIAKWLEARLEELEFHADRTHDGLMDGFIGFRDHSPFVLLSSTALLAFLILGPNLFWTPGDLPSREIQHASWYFGLTFPLWIAKHLLKGQRAGICWIGVMIGLGAIPAFFGDSLPLIITLLISCAAIFLFGLLSRLPDWLKENLENAQKWTQWFIWGLFYSGCALWFWSLVAEWNTGVKPNTLRLAALVITVGFLLIWAKRGWKPKRLGLVFFLIVAAWSIPMICATPWKLTGQTIVAATATWWCGERPSFSESGEPVAPAWHPDTLGWLVQKWPVPPHHGMTLALVFGVLAWLSVLISRWFVKNAFERFRNTFKFEEKLEERNALYVAITRASSTLTILHAPQTIITGRKKHKEIDRLSQFLNHKSVLKFLSREKSAEILARAENC